VDLDRVDRAEQLARVVGDVDLLAAELDPAFPGATSDRKATFGLPGGLDSANPIISAIAIG
jgi:hypothetical protein